MRTADYIDILTGTAVRSKLNSAALSSQEFSDLRTVHSDRLATIWEHHYWPDLVLCEKRYFRALWDTVSTYAAPSLTAGVEVYYPGPMKYFQTLKAVIANQPPATLSAGVWTTDTTQWADAASSYAADPYDSTKAYVRGNQVFYSPTDRYYQLYAATSTGNLPTDATKWGVLTPFDRYVSFTQTGLTAFEHCFSVWSADVKNFRDAIRYQSRLSRNGVQVFANVPYAWLLIRTLCPSLTGDAYSATTVYVANQQLYYPLSTSGSSLRGNFYTANQTTVAGDTPDSAPSKFDIVNLPLAFRRYLVHGGAADYLRAQPDQEVADREELLATEALDRCVQLIFGQQGQDTEVEFITR